IHPQICRSLARSPFLDKEDYSREGAKAAREFLVPGPDPEPLVHRLTPQPSLPARRLQPRLDASQCYAEGTVRTLIALAAAVCASAQSPLTKILATELERNFTILKQKADPPPYFIAYEVTESEGNGLSATRGAMTGVSQNHVRVLDVTVRTGDSKFDSYRVV